VSDVPTQCPKLDCPDPLRRIPLRPQNPTFWARSLGVGQWDFSKDPPRHHAKESEGDDALVCPRCGSTFRTVVAT
jgi:hypothetical protein